MCNMYYIFIYYNKITIIKSIDHRAVEGLEKNQNIKYTPF